MYLQKFFHKLEPKVQKCLHGCGRERNHCVSDTILQMLVVDLQQIPSSSASAASQQADTADLYLALQRFSFNLDPYAQPSVGG
jgi:hypothetical protein